MKAITFLFLLLAISCKNASEKADKPTGTPLGSIELPGDHNVDTTKLKDYKVILENKDFPGLSLKKADIFKADELLLKSLTAYNNQSINNPGNRINLRYYVRYYESRLNEKGEKEVVIQGSCSVDSHNKWKTGVEIVMDGGKCYFVVIVNLTHNTYGKLFPNGDA